MPPKPPTWSTAETRPRSSASTSGSIRPDNKPITLKSLRGKVVLVDFWAYSCINCQRSTPHLNAWYRSYQKDGFVIVGVHAPEYAFEHVPANVLASAKQQGIKYPIALDNEFDTWTAYSNQYWPAEYLIDATGQVRHISFGEGNYSVTEKLIRSLLVDAKPSVSLPKATDVPDTTPTHTLTPETYLGSERPSGTFSSPGGYRAGTSTYSFPSASLALNDYAFSGSWAITDQAITAEAAGSSDPPSLRGATRLPERERHGNADRERLAGNSNDPRLRSAKHP